MLTHPHEPDFASLVDFPALHTLQGIERLQPKPLLAEEQRWALDFQLVYLSSAACVQKFEWNSGSQTLARGLSGTQRSRKQLCLEDVLARPCA